jgi:prepilin-type N-terminal cleavage/methylation domain-containing protein/prepilin-type processing-associated H-X9-DG protein
MAIREQDMPSRRNRAGTHRPIRRAFTLVELLVVISILSVLVALLIPAVALIHQHVQSAKCLSNLRQIGLAVSNYAVDNENCLVPGDYFGLEDGFWQLGAGSWADTLAAQRYINVPILHTPFAGATETDDDARVNLERDNILLCPSGIDQDVLAYNFPTSQTDPLGMMFAARASDTTLDVVCSWYAANLTPEPEYFGQRPLPFNFLPDFNPQTGAMDWTINRMSKFHDTTRLPLIYDGIWMFWNNPNLINARHGNRTQTNILFADFHCESQLTSSLPNNNWYVN